MAIILVIAVPKVMSVIEDAKKATLESTAKVTITGAGKFEGLNVCDATKTSAVAQEESCTVPIVAAVRYLKDLLEQESTLNNGLVQTNAEYNGTTYDAGIRYAGTNPNNKVYYNCDDKDTNNVNYGEENYDYASSCEVWRIIGVFDTKSSTSGSTEKRVKIINANSTFKASWDSSAGDVDYGYGINQWGPSGEYLGADLMQLLNGYYIGKSDSVCKYCNGNGQATCEQTCTAESLRNANMKVLTNIAKSMIDSAVWDTYAVGSHSLPTEAYLMEKGITHQYTGKSLCKANGGGDYCNDNIERTTSWTGLVGLMSLYDIYAANGWLYSPSIDGQLLYLWSISPIAYSGSASYVRGAVEDGGDSWSVSYQSGVCPAVYLKSNIQIISGDGGTEPYKLKA